MEYNAVGIDISKNTLDVYRSDTKRFWRVPNIAEDIGELI